MRPLRVSRLLGIAEVERKQAVEVTRNKLGRNKRGRCDGPALGIPEGARG
jgi:hypothetical protein